VGTASRVNASGGTYVSYLFGAVAGRSAMGRYTGNGSQVAGTSVTLDFKPDLLLIKRIDSTGGWWLFDSYRSTANPREFYIALEDGGGEAALSAPFGVDFNTTGFQLKSSNDNLNASGGTYVYYAARL
jgi:hypothetical protein